MAIKVNGTTVINDSRALTNIASVDATTVAAIGAAGVGGETTLLVDRANIADGTSYVEVSFTGGYQRYIVTLEFARKQDYPSVQESGSYLVAQYSDSSGNQITSNGSHVCIFGESNQSDNASNYAYLTFARTDYHFLTMDVRNPYDTNIKTVTDFSLKSISDTGSARAHSYGAFWLLRGDSNVRTNSLRVLTGSQAGGQMASGKYSVWGVSA